MLTTERFRLLAVILCLALCSILAASPPGLQAQETGIAKKLKVKVNDQMTIELPANPSTGYGWDVEYDKDYLDLLAEDFRDSRKPGDLRLGAGGTSCFTFRALKAGLTKVILKYQRPWAPEPEPEVETYHVLIN